MYELIRSNITTNDFLASISGGGGGGETYTAGTIVPTFAEVVGAVTTNIPAGAYKVTVWNTGVETITVNGDDVLPGTKWEVEHAINKVTSKQDFTQEIDIDVPAGGTASYQVYRPSV